MLIGHYYFRLNAPQNERIFVICRLFIKKFTMNRSLHLSFSPFLSWHRIKNLSHKIRQKKQHQQLHTNTAIMAANELIVIFSHYILKALTICSFKCVYSFMEWEREKKTPLCHWQTVWCRKLSDLVLHSISKKNEIKVQQNLYRKHELNGQCLLWTQLSYAF